MCDTLCICIGTAYGAGSYFATNFLYSAHYGRRKVFYANVLTGMFAKGDSGMLVAPDFDKNRGIKYDSVVNCIYEPIIFVVFSDNHAYPSYLITYAGDQRTFAAANQLFQNFPAATGWPAATAKHAKAKAFKRITHMQASTHYFAVQPAGFFSTGPASSTTSATTVVTPSSGHFSAATTTAASGAASATTTTVVPSSASATTTQSWGSYLLGLTSLQIPTVGSNLPAAQLSYVPSWPPAVQNSAPQNVNNDSSQINGFRVDKTASSVGGAGNSSGGVVDAAVSTAEKSKEGVEALKNPSDSSNSNSNANIPPISISDVEMIDLNDRGDATNKK